MILDKKVEITLTPNNYKHFRELGYTQKVKTKIFVSPEELTDCSHILEERKCDCCGKDYTETHQHLVRSFKTFNHDYCPECVEHNIEIQKLKKEKAIKTSQEKHGTDYPSQDPSVKEKKATSYFNKTGYTSPAQNPEVKEKIKKTNLEKYGVEVPTQSKEIYAKIKSTNLKRYGVETSLLNKEVQEKVQQSKYKHGSVPSSKQQDTIYEMCKEFYNDWEVTLNKPFSNINFDICLEKDGIIIDIEYDCQYWHQDKAADVRRDKFAQSNGVKVLRIKSKTIIPTIEDIDTKVQELITTDRKYVSLKLKDWKE